MLLRKVTPGTMARWTALLIMLVQPPTWAAAQQTDAKAIARAHFDQGVAAFKDKRFQEAASEFDAAYKLSPAIIVLYNIGQVDIVLGRPVEAVEALERYLADGAGSVAPDRQAEVQAEIEEQRARIGMVAVTTQPVNAELRVDGLVVGKTPLARPIAVAAGSHAIEARRSGYLSQLQRFEVTGGTRIELVLMLDPVLTAVEPSPPTAAPLVSAPPPSQEKNPLIWRRASGYALMGIGLVAAVTGGVVAVESVSAAEDARNRAIAAAGAKMPTAMDVSKYNQAKTDFDSAMSRNHVGWIVAGAGVAAFAGGTALIVTSPAPHASGVALAGTW